MRLGVALGAHTHPFETLLELVRRAEALGYARAWVDGDVSMMRRPEVLDGWTVTTALLARTERIAIASLRLAHHWNAARLAQAAATAHRLFGDRFVFVASAGAQPVDRRFGLPWGSPAERIARLGETLEAVRALWRGEPVTRAGRFVHLDEARIAPAPPGGRLPIEIAGRGRRLLGLVAAHADAWDVNLPPLRERVEPARAWLAEACERVGRDPAGIATSMWLFTRVGRDPEDPAVEAEFRRLNPWFEDVPSEALGEALVVGDAARCTRRVMEIHQVLGIDLPILDLTGLDAPASQRALEALAPLAQGVVDPGESRT